jgi:hypothetical protein
MLVSRKVIDGRIGRFGLGSSVTIFLCSGTIIVLIAACSIVGHRHGGCCHDEEDGSGQGMLCGESRKN